MMEDIKKEVEHCFDDVYLEDKKFVIATFINILDKYKDKEDKYKNAFKELKEHFYKVNTEVDSSCYDVELELIDKLEQKHGIEVE